MQPSRLCLNKCSLRRDRLLAVIHKSFPEIYPFIRLAYRSPSTLFFVDYTILSATGVQQGDPLGPALFSLTVHSFTTSLSSSLNVWYLDDGTVGGEVDQALADFELILQHSASLGLQLNTAKCELILSGMDGTEAEEIAPSIHHA